jgi:hypothetical protein
MMHDPTMIMGVVIDSETKPGDGIYCVSALRRKALKMLSIDPKTLPDEFTASMEVRFRKADCKYQIGDAIYTYEQARVMGIANGPTERDDPSKYDVRWIKPEEFHGCALCYKGTEADHGAEYMAVSATSNLLVDSGEGNKPDDGGANVDELTKFKDEVLPGLIAEAKAEGEKAGRDAAEVEAKATLDAKEAEYTAALAAKDAEVASAKADVDAKVAAELDSKVAEAKASAIEEYKAVEAKATVRFGELHNILPYQEDERVSAMDSMRSMDDLAFANAKAERALKAVEVAKANTASATTATPPTVTATATGSKTVRNPWLAPKEQ